MKFVIFKIGYAAVCLMLFLISRPAAAVPSSLSPELLTVDVRMGKLVIGRVDPTDFTMQMSSDVTTTKRTNRMESTLHIFNDTNGLCVDYMQIAPAGTVQLQMRGGTLISMFGTDTKNRRYYTFSQSDDGMLRLESGSLDDERLKEVENREKFIVPFDRQFDPSASVFTTSNVWEMFIFVPESQRGDWERVFGLLCKKNAIRGFQDMFARVLVQTAQEAERGTTEENAADISTLLGGLNHDSLAVRNASERKLRKLGVRLLFELESKNWKEFTPEQQIRLKYIVNDFSFQSDFERESFFAVKLRTRPVAWWWAMASEDLSVRIYAWQQLQRLRQTQPGDFNAIPDTDFSFHPEEKNSAERTKQLELLKTCLRL